MIEKSLRLNHWNFLDMLDVEPCPIPISTNYPIIKAEQTKPNSRAAKRQARREQSRKWKVEYMESEGRT